MTRLPNDRAERPVPSRSAQACRYASTLSPLHLQEVLYRQRMKNFSQGVASAQESVGKNS